jgi:hypothetical protein
MQHSTEFLSFRQYANRIGVNVSSVSRAVAKNQLPTVTRDGTRLIDVKAADAAWKARQRYTTPGGSREQHMAKAARWRAKADQGYDLGQLKILAVLMAHAPALTVEGLRATGMTDERDLARAAAVVRELVDYLAVTVHDDLNKACVGDYREPLPTTVPPDVSSEALALFEELTDPVSDPWPDEWRDALFTVFRPAKF